MSFPFYEGQASFIGKYGSVETRVTALEKPKCGCVFDLATNISYPDGSSNYNYLGQSPEWVANYDQFEDFDQTTQVFNISQKGCYMITLTIMPDTVTNKYIQVYIEILQEDKTTLEREYVLEYSTYAYHRGGSIITPPLRLNQGIRIRLIPSGTANTVMRGITSGTGVPRVHNHFSIMQLDDASVG